jgi:hypothetical protein
VGTFETSENAELKLSHLAAVCVVVVCFDLDSISLGLMTGSDKIVSAGSIEVKKERTHSAMSLIFLFSVICTSSENLLDDAHGPDTENGHIRSGETIFESTSSLGMGSGTR